MPNLSDSYDRIGAGEVQAGARTAAAGVWRYSQPSPPSISNSPKLINSLVALFQQVHSSSLTEAGESDCSADRRSHELLRRMRSHSTPRWRSNRDQF